jgi:hypothetical protein
MRVEDALLSPVSLGVGRSLMLGQPREKHGTDDADDGR